MKTTLVIAFTLGRLLFACDPKTPSDPMRDAGPPDATTEPDAANQPDADTSDSATVDAATTDAATSVTCPQARQVPFPEVCNAFDDDCDGLMDEGACTDPCDEAW